MERQRLTEIDLIKTVGIVGVIAIHVLTYNLTGPISRFIWNYAQFVVIAFVFSSGYILPIAYSESFRSISSILHWYKKRLIRLLGPFYIFLIAQYCLWILFPSLFQGLGLKKSFDYFLNSAFLIGGTNFNFLPLLFVELSLLFPLLLKTSKNRTLTIIYLALAGLVTFYFTFFGFPYAYYRLVMWIPWSLVLFLATWMVVNKKTNIKIENFKYLVLAIVFSLWFVILFVLNRLSGHSLNFYDHKYPPDFYYLFYGLAATLFLIILARFKIFNNSKLLKVNDFISRNSYSIFFIHYIALDSFLKLRGSISVLQNPLFLFIAVFAVSIVGVTAMNKFRQNLLKS